MQETSKSGLHEELFKVSGSGWGDGGRGGWLYLVYPLNNKDVNIPKKLTVMALDTLYKNQAY